MNHIPEKDGLLQYVHQKSLGQVWNNWEWLMLLFGNLWPFLSSVFSD